MSDTSICEQRCYDVAVVGAGLSGLTAAVTLQAAGAKVAVLEARSRVGGRTLAERHGNAVFDLGGQWIGPSQPRINALVRELGLQTFGTWDRGAKILELTGRCSTYTSSIPSLPILKLLDLNRGIQRAERMCRQIPLESPDQAELARQWDALTVAGWEQRFAWSESTRQLLDAAFRVVFGAESSELSLLHTLFYLHSAGGLQNVIEIKNAAQQDRVVGGTQQISARLAQQLTDGVLTDAAVREIESSGSELKLSGRFGTCRARYVIMALAPSLAGQIQYHPALPALRTQLTQRFPMGQTIKCIALYDEPFWRDSGYSGEVVSGDGPLSVVYDNTSHDGAQPALLGFLCAGPARYWGARPEAERRQAVLGALARYFGPRAAQPVSYLEKNWGDDPYSAGCPTGYAPPGVITNCWSALREPIGHIHWAGTETATEHTGYMEGALQAGHRAAQEVIARL